MSPRICVLLVLVIIALAAFSEAIPPKTGFTHQHRVKRQYFGVPSASHSNANAAAFATSQSNGFNNGYGLGPFGYPGLYGGGANSNSAAFATANSGATNTQFGRR